MKWYLIVAVGICFVACTEQPKQQEKKEVFRDTSINRGNAYTGAFFDSAALENFIRTEQLQDTAASNLKTFYAGRNYEYAWFAGDSLDEQADNLINLISDYTNYSGDSSLINKKLQRITDTLDTDEHEHTLAGANKLRAELYYTLQFFAYANKVFRGSDIKVEDLGWFIPRKKINVVQLLDSMTKNKGRIDKFEPKLPQYSALKQYLLKYYDIQKQGGWLPIASANQKFHKGDNSPAVTHIKKRLSITGDYSLPDTSTIFSDSLVVAVKNFQHRYGMKEDGVVGGATLREMNQPIETRIRQLLLNLERLRWLPASHPGGEIVVNIPEFKLHFVDTGQYTQDMNVVVGKAANSTTIFSGRVKHVVFSPYWNVPPSIVRNEILPAMKKDKHYLDRNNMEITGNSGGLPVIRQKPGPKNSLGLVKFLFPNSYSIYMHDTPAKGLFNQEKRAFSHGCIRLQDPVRMAAYLLRNEKKWTIDKIKEAMNSGKEQYATVKDPPTVYILYFTAWIDRSGKLNFRDDVYGHDAALAAKLF